jgi:glycogen phosphorylase
LAARGASPEDLAQAAQILDENVLTLGFARRFATYKRPNLLLHDPARLINILTNADRPVQLVLAGKAHPQDTEGQEMITQWIEFARRPEARSRVVFLSDYDVLMAEHLVQGVDVWVNTPRRPWEASGTSGMKVLVNGGLNLSELDGWWAEAYSPEVGWAIGDGREHGDDPSWDAEAESLYAILETEVVPEFYSRDEHGIPRNWVARMRESMARLTPVFSTNRVSPPIYRRTLSLCGSSLSRARRESRFNGSRSRRLAGRTGEALVWRCDSARNRRATGRAISFHVQVFLAISIPTP